MKFDEFITDLQSTLHDASYDFEHALEDVDEDVPPEVIYAMEQAQYAAHQLITKLENYLAKTKRRTA